MHSYYQTQFPYSPLANNGLTPLLLKEESDGRFHPTNKPFEVFENQVLGLRYLRLNDDRIYRRSFTPRGQRGYIEYDALIIAREIENFIAFTLAEAPYEVTEVSRYYGDSQFYDSDAEAYIAAVELADGEPLEPAVRMVYHRHARRIKAAGLWDPTAQYTPGAGPRTLAGALVPLLGSPLTNVNFVEGDYNRVKGLTPSPDKYLEGVPGDTYGKDDFTLFAFITSPIVPLGSVMRFFGSDESTSGATAYVSYPSEVFAFRPKGSTILSSVSPDGFTGFLGVERTGSNAARVVMGPTITTSASMSGGNLSVPVQYFTYGSRSYTGCPSMTSFFYGPYADGAVWRDILDLFHSELSAALS